jgi:hypothetical protein
MTDVARRRRTGRVQVPAASSVPRSRYRTSSTRC